MYFGILEIGLLFVFIICVIGLLFRFRKVRWFIGIACAVPILFILFLSLMSFRKITKVDTYPSVVYVPLPSSTSSVTPEVWMDGLEEQFTADVYPSMLSASQALARQLAVILPDVLPQKQTPSAVQIYGKLERGKLNSQTLYAAAEQLRAAGIQKVSVETVPPDKPIENTDEVSINIEVSMPQYSYGGKSLSGGTLIMNLSGSAGNITRTAVFSPKPWVDNLADYINSNPDGHWLVAQSQSSCVTQDSARREAMQNARQKIKKILKTRESPTHFKPFHHLENHLSEIELDKIIVDRFAQSFQGSNGPIWREALLIDASPEKLHQLIADINVETNQSRRTWLTKIFSVVGMLIFICVVYLFLNAATRGYYTWALRVMTIVLIIAGAYMILTFVRA